MNPDWQAYLEQNGARIEAGRVVHFGDAAAELEAASRGGVVADLSHLAVLEFTGDEAEAFLQGQLSCDVKALQPGGASLGSYCSPKGRMLASFLLVRSAAGWLMVHSRSLTAGLQKRLQMYVLRAKVAVRDRSDDLVLLGVAGDLPDGTDAAALPDGRRVLLLTPEQARHRWPALSAALRPVGSPAWQWLDIRAGIPLITEATRDQLVPQMANLELVGGVSFSKGCYPGQEIVARSQYLGKVKRRMYLASVDAPSPPSPGEPLFSDDMGDQASGLVVAAQPSPEGGYDLLAVAQAGSREGSVVRLGSARGPVLRFAPLPYEVT